MVISILALTLPLLGGTGSDLSATATMAPEELEILWGVHSFTVALDVPPEDEERFGWHGRDESKAPKAPRPILELDLPDCIELLGVPPQELKTPADFAAYYIDEPYGRAAVAPTMEVKFRVTRTPLDTDTIGINVTGYLGQGKKARFQRLRLELPVRAGARATEGDARNSRWGRRMNFRIGEHLPDVKLPSTKGTISPRALFGEKGLLVATYRAHW